MERAITNFFAFAEAPLTLFGGLYALASPVLFINTLLPARLAGVVAGLDAAEGEILNFVIQIYGLVLVLLGLAEFLIFMVKGQVHSKRSLLLPMAIADVIHLVVFCRFFLVDSQGAWVQLDAYKAWSSSEWTAFCTNVPLIVVMLLARVIFLGTATGQTTPVSAKKRH